MASDFKLFKKKDDKKNNGQNFSLSDKSKFAIAARTVILAVRPAYAFTL